MNQKTTQLRQEIDEIPNAVDRLLSDGWSNVRGVADVVRDYDPRIVLTAARGSSDHVCTLIKYAIEITLGIPVASTGPSIASIYGSKLHVNGALCLAVSQSGKGPDILSTAKSIRRDGAMTIAVSNGGSSPLATATQYAIDTRAGPELSVAATKTFVTSAVAILLLLGEWRRDQELLSSLFTLPRQLEVATRIDWAEVREVVANQPSMFTLGRGLTLGVSNEAALKFKETCQIHAESFSSAEVLHGPVTIVADKFPILAFAGIDAAEQHLAEVADAISLKGGKVFATSCKVNHAQPLEFVGTDHPLTTPLSLIVSFYSMVEALAASQGIDPDQPRHLKKITQTV